MSLSPAACLLPLLALPPATAWRDQPGKDGVIARTAPSGSGAPWGYAEGEINAPPAAVLAHLTDFAHLVGRVPRLREARVVEPATVDAEGLMSAVVYFDYDLPWPLSDRDYTVRYRWAPEAFDGAPAGSEGWRIVVEDAEYLGPPASKSAVRVRGIRGEWRVAPVKDAYHTLLRYTLLADFGGSLPQSVRDQTAWRQPMETIIGVRKSVESRAGK